MENFNTLEELTQHCKNNFQMLIKFGSLENLEKLQKGSLYMKNLKYYNDLEEIKGSGKPDKYDGKWLLQDCKLTFSDTTTKQSFYTGKAKSMIMSFGLEKNPVFCLFSLDYRNCGGYEVDEEAKTCIISVSFTDEQKEKLKEGLGEYALVITNTDSFLQKISNVLNKDGAEFVIKRVLYNHGNSIERMNSILSNSENIAFNKSDTDFAYQQELRILVRNREVEDYIEFDIGNIEGISKIILSEELLKLQIELRQGYVPQ